MKTLKQSFKNDRKHLVLKTNTFKIFQLHHIKINAYVNLEKNCFKANYFKDKLTNILLGYICTEHALVQLLTEIFHKDLIIISKTAYTCRRTFTLACNRAYNYHYNYFLLMLRTVLNI